MAKRNKRKRKPMRKSRPKLKRRVTGKKASRPKVRAGYDISTGKPTGRDASAMGRLEKLTEKYVAEGMSLAEARAKARAEMRANPRMDWRVG
jgi:hypothetical protein